MAKNYAYIGSENCPIPYMNDDGQLVLLRDDNTYIRLPVMYDGTPEDVQAKVLGKMMRNFPVRSRINDFMENLRRRSDNIDANVASSNIFERRRRAKFIKGEPGRGKTHDLKTLCKMVDPQGGIYVNCKDRDLKTLIVQTVLDTSNIDVEKNAIDARIKMYNKGDKSALSAEGISLLKTMFDDAFTIDESGKISLDWNGARGNTSLDSADRDKEFVSLLQQFCKRENIDYSYNINSVGFVEKDGELLQALESGRPIILDEINRGKNQDFLLPYLDFLNGSYEDMKITGANGREVHLSKEDLPDTFMLEATGNPETAEMGIKEKMSEPLRDRFDISEMADFNPKDFTDMYCSLMTGVPVSIIKDAYQLENEEDLSNVCKFLRTVGLSKKEIDAIPPEQMIYLDNVGMFLETAQCIGKALYEVYQFKKDTVVSSNTAVYCEDQVLRKHIQDEPYSFRILEDICNRARTYIPQRAGKAANNPFLNYSFAKPSGSNTLQMRLRNQGEGWEKAIMGAVKEVFSCQGMNPELGGQILGMANQILGRNGIGDEEKLMEARSLEQPRLKDMFNFPIPGEKNTKRASQEALRIQETICKMVRERYPSNESKSNDEIVDPFVIEGVLTTVRENPLEQHALLGKAILVNNAEETNNQMPFIKNAAVVETLGLHPPVETKHLADVDAFLTTLTINGLSESNLGTIWPNIYSADKDKSEAREVLSGRHNRIAYNSFVLKDSQDNPVALDIVHVKMPDGQKAGEPHTLIVGEKISQVMMFRLKQNGITYIDRSSEDVAEGGDTDNKLSVEKRISEWIKKAEENSNYDNLEDLLIGAVDEKFNITVVGNVQNLFKSSLESENREINDMAQITTFTTSELDRGVDKVSTYVNDGGEVSKETAKVFRVLYNLSERSNEN